MARTAALLLPLLALTACGSHSLVGGVKDPYSPGMRAGVVMSAPTDLETGMTAFTKTLKNHPSEIPAYMYAGVMYACKSPPPISSCAAEIFYQQSDGSDAGLCISTTGEAVPCP